MDLKEIDHRTTRPFKIARCPKSARHSIGLDRAVFFTVLARGGQARPGLSRLPDRAPSLACRAGILLYLPEPGTLQMAHSGVFRLGNGVVNSFVGCGLFEA